MTSATQPVQDAPASAKYQLGVTLVLGALVITNSTCMIAFNRYLMQKDHFPYAEVLVIVQFAFSFVVSLTLFKVQPTLFPSLSDSESKVVVNSELILKKVLPVGACFCVPLLLSNTAYEYASVAFLQMMKQSGVVFVHLLSLVVGLEVFKFRNLAVLFLILFATMVSVDGELNFSLIGVIMQGTAILVESMKIVLQGMLLKSKGIQLDAMSYVLLTAPVCLTCLLTLFGIQSAMPIHGMATPSWSEMAAWWPYLLGNAVIAYGLNIVIAAFIKQTSPTGLCLAAILKDTSIVLMGVAVLHEAISTTQVFSFTAQVNLIALWSLMKSFPAEFEEGIGAGLQAVLLGKKPSALQAESGKVGKYGAAEDAVAKKLLAPSKCPGDSKA